MHILYAYSTAPANLTSGTGTDPALRPWNVSKSRPLKHPPKTPIAPMSAPP